MQFNEALHKQGLQHILAAVLGICFPIYAASYVFLTGKHKQTIYDKVGNRVVLVKGPPRTRLIVCIAAALVITTGGAVAFTLNAFRDLSSASWEKHDRSAPKAETKPAEQK